MDDDEPDYDDDRYDEYKDGVAMGYINPDGTQREPDEPDQEALAYWRHCDDEHGGMPCNCPPPDPGTWELPEGKTYAEEAPF
jgi:hypothetical protein